MQTPEIETNFPKFIAILHHTESKFSNFHRNLTSFPKFIVILHHTKLKFNKFHINQNTHGETRNY